MTTQFASHSQQPLIMLLVPELSYETHNLQHVWETEGYQVQPLALGREDTPNRNNWVNKINLALQGLDSPIVLVAYGLACHAVAWWVALERPSHRSPVSAALLVSPLEVDIPSTETAVTHFAPTPIGILPFRSVIAVGSAERSISLPRAKRLASFWGSKLVVSDYLSAAHDDLVFGASAEGRAVLRQIIHPDATVRDERELDEEARKLAAYQAAITSYPI